MKNSETSLYELLGMIRVEPGAFSFGRHGAKVTITRPFELGRFPVTNLVWSLVTGKPAEDELFLPRIFADAGETLYFTRTLNWLFNLRNAERDAVGLELNLKEGGFRLPTEVEWEYACKAGGPTPIYGHFDDIAWHEGCSGGDIHPVGLKLPNAWGFYDMMGNVFEWCWDRYEEIPTQLVDPTGPETGFDRVHRGGTMCDVEQALYASTRFYREPDFRGYRYLGFRLARTQPSEESSQAKTL